MGDPVKEIDKSRELPVREWEKQRILGGNAAEILGLGGDA